MLILRHEGTFLHEKYAKLMEDQLVYFSENFKIQSQGKYNNVQILKHYTKK